MKPWPKYPLIYEINTWVWLRELGEKYQRPITLASVPSEEWDALASFGFDAVWFMGVWERSPAGIRISMKNEGLLADFRRALPDFTERDNVGSPYCVRRYLVDAELGGREGLALAREQLAKRGLRLVLDYVPNHVAPDHPWAFEHPEYFIQGTAEDLEKDPAAFLPVGEKIIACGKDPSLSRLARCAAAQCLPSRTPPGGHRYRYGNRFPVRRHAMRHGHAPHESDF